MLAKLGAWVIDRCGLGGNPTAVLGKRLPPGIGWLNTLGTVTLVLLLVQVVTGMVLAMYYSPHPEAAYMSMDYLDHKVPMGRMVHGMHRYGDSALLVLVMLHLLRTYLQGTYKAPREVVWLLGVVLLQLMLGFGFTGSLLPWDQNAYWATLVRTEYPGSLPVVGPFAQYLLRGGRDVGAMTLTRFYAIHALILPALILLFVQLHALLAWKKGVTAPGSRVGEVVPATGPRVDEQWLRNMLASFLAVAGLVAYAAMRPAELEFKADPADASYHPHAEWYFLWLLQLVKDCSRLPLLEKLPGWVPALGVPGIAFTFLALAPWLDRGPERAIRKRPLMLGALIAGVLGIGGMSARAFVLLRPNATPANSVYGHFTSGGETELPVELINRGRAVFGAAKPVPCSACHRAYSDYNQRAAPDLSGYGRKSIPQAEIKGQADLNRMSFHMRFQAYVRGVLRPENTKMPKYFSSALSEAELDAIGAYLSQDPMQVERQRAAPKVEKRP